MTKELHPAQFQLDKMKLDQIEEITLGHYNQNASSFWQGTKDHDVSQNYQAFLAQFSERERLELLDFGCGPGRDLSYFDSLGHHVTGLDGSEEFCSMAQQYSGCDVLHQNFLKLDLPAQSFDGIFANASLFHVPSQELSRVLRELHTALRPNGILFTSNPRGNDEGWSGQRYGYYAEFEAAQTFLTQAGFTVLDHYYRPQGAPKSDQRWLAIVSRKS